MVLQSKDARLLLRMTGELAAEIRIRADRNERTISAEIRTLIRAALEHERASTAGEKRLLSATGSKRKEEKAS